MCIWTSGNAQLNSLIDSNSLTLFLTSSGFYTLTRCKRISFLVCYININTHTCWYRTSVCESEHRLSHQISIKFVHSRCIIIDMAFTHILYVWLTLLHNVFLCSILIAVCQGRTFMCMHSNALSANGIAFQLHRLFVRSFVRTIAFYYVSICIAHTLTQYVWYVCIGRLLICCSLSSQHFNSKIDSNRS